MKRIKSISLTLILSMILITSCSTRKEPLLHENAVVIEKQYVPEVYQTATGTGFTSNGNVVISTHTISESEKYIVIFKCEHNVLFSVNRPELFANLNKGDSVKVDYYELTSLWGTGDGYDFIGAYKK